MLKFALRLIKDMQGNIQLVSGLELDSEHGLGVRVCFTPTRSLASNNGVVNRSCVPHQNRSAASTLQLRHSHDTASEV